MRKNRAVFSERGDTLQVYLEEIKQIPLLTFEEEIALSKRIQKGDASAKEKLIKANSRLVIKIVRTYVAADVSLVPDMIQEGNLGLIHAAEKYDHEKNARFSTYASWWIRQYISRFLVNKRRDIHLPHRKEECLRKLRKVEQALSQTLMRQPTTEEIATEMEVPAEEIRLLLSRTGAHIPLEIDGTDEESSAVLDTYEDYTYNPEQAFFRKFSQDNMIRILNRLKVWEKWVLMHRYQLNGCKRYTLRTIGDKMRISPETVRQIENKALKKIHTYAEELRENLYIEVI
ncbi:MAG: sigma-70 family RNA polymerase sigma factor [Treponema sp.]|jgi:RNA polymerase primary sigma factor|nr:sigma-70 family RNA polymerase sigma factor [Treponema sp.]